MPAAIRDRVDAAVPTFERPAVRASGMAVLIARSRANVQWSRRLCEQAQNLIARSARLCPTPMGGASDANEIDMIGPRPTSNGQPHPWVADLRRRRSVLVLAPDPVLRRLIADAMNDGHEIAEVSDVPAALKVVASGARVDVVVIGCGMHDHPGAPLDCTTAAHELYERHPWLPVVVAGDTPSPRLTADLLLTGVRTFLPKAFTPAELVAAVARVARRPEAPVPTTARVAAVRQIFAVLEKAITDVPALATLAAMVGMSRSHFSRTFHAAAGISLRDYVRDLRLKRAQELMRASRLSLSAIAAEAGFYDLPHFNKAFRHRFGMSPTQFRLASSSSPAT
jgi:AraC-like DNA-binding protein/CheY-like chemotaxis protein